MKRHLRIFVVMASLFLCWGAAPAYAAEQVELRAFEVAPEVRLQMRIPGTAWTVTKTAPQFLVDKAVEDIKGDLKAAGKSATDEQIMERVRQQLGSNELYVFNPASKAVLEVDFSPLREGESAPSRDGVKASATAAGESMASEGGVSGSQYRVAEAKVPGIDTAYRLDIDFTADGAPRKFIGLIGFTEGNWVFFYYTDRLAVPSDLEQMEKILASLTVQSNVARLGEGKKAFADQDYARALQIFSSLADQGDAEALYYIGFMHMKGYGVPQDHKAAAEWYQKAAERGSVAAQNNLGFVYAKGDHGLPQDYRQAAKWYRMAAENGDVASQYNIGLMYLEGTGVAKDPVMAYAFSSWAAEGGDENARGNMTRAEKEMSPAQMEKARQELAQLKSRIARQ